MMRIGIIGGGATGLAAAYELAKAGQHVSVYERAPFLGGHASTFDLDGVRLERGYHHWFTSDTDIVELMEEIGLSNQVKWMNSQVGALVDGKIYPFSTPLDLLKFTPLPILDRIRLGVVSLYLQRMKKWQNLEPFTAADWLRRYSGEKTFKVFWGPLLRGKFGEDHYASIGMPWIWGKLHTRFASRSKSMAKEKLGYPIGSFGELFDTLATKIIGYGGSIHLQTTVSRIDTERGHAHGIEVVAPDGSKRIHHFDAIISTAPSHIMERIAPNLGSKYIQQLNKVKYMSAVLLVLILKRPLSNFYWLNIADRTIPFVGVIEHTNLISSEHYGGKHIVYLSNYLSNDHAMYNMSRKELLDYYMPHLISINSDFEPSWITTSYHHRIDEAQPIIGINYSQEMPNHRTPIKNIYLANTTQIYPEDRGTNYSVRMAKEVVHIVLSDITTGFPL